MIQSGSSLAWYRLENTYILLSLEIHTPHPTEMGPEASSSIWAQKGEVLDIEKNTLKTPRVVVLKTWCRKLKKEEEMVIDLL